MKLHDFVSAPRATRGQATLWVIILTDFDFGQCLRAIDEVALRGKPLAEVGQRSAAELAVGELKADLRSCIEMSGFPVTAYIIADIEIVRFGFFQHRWVGEALMFVEEEADQLLPRHHIHWLQGLLFGFTPAAIDQFIERLRALNEDPCNGATVRCARREDIRFRERDGVPAGLALINA